MDPSVLDDKLHVRFRIRDQVDGFKRVSVEDDDIRQCAGLDDAKRPLIGAARAGQAEKLRVAAGQKSQAMPLISQSS